MTWPHVSLSWLLVLVLFLPLSRPTLAQSSARAASADLLLQAEERFAAGDLPEAEQLFLRALPSVDSLERRRCYDALLVIYSRLGRHDRAIRIGTAYQPLLQRSGNRLRLHELRLQMGECLFGLGHWRLCESTLEEVLKSADAAVLPLARQLTAVTLLARTAEIRGERERARRRWEQVEALASAQLRDARQPLSPPQRIDCTRQLAESFRARGQPDRASALLKPLLRLHDEQDDPRGRCETLKRLAACHTAGGDREAAQDDLRQALALYDRHRLTDPLLHGDLLDALADVLLANQPGEAGRLRQQAIAAYERVLKAPQGQRAIGALTAFWKLQRHYQQASQYALAVRLAEGRTDQWGLLLRPRLSAEQGSLQVLLGVYKEGLPLLRDAVAQFQSEDPPNLIELPRALNNLAIVEQATEDPRHAEEHGRQCLELYRRYELPADLVQAEAYNLLGTAIALRGNYAEAIASFRAGAGICVRLGTPADPEHSTLLLNIALLHKAQGDLVEALRVCEQAQAIFERFAPPDSLGRGAFLAARTGLLVAQGQVDAAHALIDGLLVICRKHDVQGGPLWVVALHCRGLYHLNRRELDAAEDAWRRLEKLLVEEKQTLLLPRTLNYLALTAEVRGQLDEAERRYRRAYELQQGGVRTFPVTRFITAWRLAEVAYRLGRRNEARQLLEQALAEVESARLQTFGDSQQRATYFAQFAPAIDQLVRWSLRDDDREAALAAIARGRSRTLLDQLQTAHVDPRETLRGPEGDHLRRREAELRRRLGGLRARAQLIALAEAETATARKLLSEFDAVQKEYTEVWREVVNANPVYRSLSVADPLARVRAVLRGLGPRTMLLVYYLGEEDGWLLMGHAGQWEVSPLVISAEVAQRVAAPPPQALGAALAGGRGLVLESTHSAPPAPPPGPSGPTVALNQGLARAVVGNYLRQIAHPQFDGTRALVFSAQQPSEPVPPQRLELLGDVLLPPPVRRRIQEVHPDKLLVVADGPLHKIPLESLVTASGAETRYLLDELPPIVYCPSLLILALLNERRPPAPAPLSLLTVANPAYPEPDKTTGAQVIVTSAVGLRGQLPRLPGTAEESARIRRIFDVENVVSLTGTEATEARVVAAVRGKRVLHLAAHGFAEERFGNLFGALALTPPAKAEGPENDGFLSLHEIYHLPLEDCEVAVLSACVTNVGPQRPLEAGVTLASGFLTAGARRVVASHWSVDDQSTAELMSTFFQEVVAASRRGERIPYARALQKAQRHVRHMPGKSSPFYWAPFVLLGAEE
jgi:CHAT domain-containing protein/tetratricopeptide (TPR) repeat protein